jgi:hypothetical protein
MTPSTEPEASSAVAQSVLILPSTVYSLDVTATPEREPNHGALVKRSYLIERLEQPAPSAFPDAAEAAERLAKRRRERLNTNRRTK